MFLGVAWCAMPIGLTHCVVRGNEAEADFLIESLKDWESAAAVVCTFRIEDGQTDSADRIAAIKDAILFANGILIKSRGSLDAKLRYEIYHTEANMPSVGSDPKTGGPALFHNVNRAELFDRDVGVTFDPHSKYVTVLGLSRSEDSTLRKNFQAKSEFGPFSPLRFEEGLAKFIETRLRETKKGETALGSLSYTIEHPDAQHTDLVFRRRTGRPGSSSDFRFRFRTDASTPYLDFVEKLAIEGGRRMGQQVYFSDFVNSPVPIARRIKSIRLKLDGAEPPYECRQWISDDLGKRQPQESDFVLHIPANAIYGGLKKTIDPSRPQTLSLAQLSGDDGIHYGESGSYQRVETPVDQPRWSAWILGGALGLAIFVASAALLIYRRRTNWT